MDEKTIEQILQEMYMQKCRLFGALQEPARLKIAEILSMRPDEVNEHLQQMVQAGLLAKHEHEGQTIYQMDAKALGLMRESILQWTQNIQGHSCGCGCH